MQCRGGGHSELPPALLLREVFAGKGNLSLAMCRVFTCHVVEPSCYVPAHDLLKPRVCSQLKLKPQQSGQLWHFGLPCSSFSLLKNCNHGTRTRARPEGTGNLQRERVGNLLLRRTVLLCHILSEAQSFWTIENPRSSYAWDLREMRRLLSVTNSKVVTLDQCAYPRP